MDNDILEFDNKNKFEIKVDRLGFGEVKLNGNHLNKILKINIDTEVNNVSKVTLTFLADDIKCETENCKIESKKG